VGGFSAPSRSVKWIKKKAQKKKKYSLGHEKGRERRSTTPFLAQRDGREKGEAPSPGPRFAGPGQGASKKGALLPFSRPE
jgi:predicted nucleic acid-binding Zn ribbon protein